ncbi:MAG: hypothetical protein GY790_19385, partial [Bacteroidetes bacterium]|nr:hypothetical protein [Bacteroidota bacterium]
TSEQYVPGPNLRQFGTDSRRIWSASYMNLTSGGIVHPKETVLGWLDVMETPAMLKPYYAGSAKSRMMKMLRKGHSGVALSREELDKFACWIDLLVPYCGDYDENTNWTTEDWKSYKYFTSKRQLSKMEDAKNVRSYIEAQHNSKPKTRTIDKTYRNLALNPSDTQWFNLLFPHATSNSECRGEDAFLAKNAINGLKENKGHGGEHPSWGPEKTSDIWWKVDFGKEVLTDKLVLYIRADFPHDKYWNEARIEFSDGSSQKIEIGKTEKAQVFKFTGGKKKTSWVKLSGFKQTEPIGWCGLTEVEVWGWNENNDLLTNN